MDIWGTKAARLQRELDQSREALREAQETIKQQQGKFRAIVEEVSGAAAQYPGSGAAVLFMQNRRQRPAEQEVSIG